METSYSLVDSARTRDDEWWRIYSAFKRPDIIVINFPRTGCHTIIDVKTFGRGFCFPRPT